MKLLSILFCTGTCAAKLLLVETEGTNNNNLSQKPIVEDGQDYGASGGEHSENTASQLYKPACPCAKVKENVNLEWEKTHSRKRFKRSDDRIVGGYSVSENRPWVAGIWQNSIDSIGGGSLINKRYVLTAAHVICKHGLKCNDDGKTLYDVKASILVYLGVNMKEVDILNKNLKGNKQYEYGVLKALAHPGYFIKGRQLYQDIALIQLDRSVEFIPNILEPICLPLSFDKSDVVKSAEEELMVYASGWGWVFHECVTDEFGPVKDLKCKLPFTYKGLTHHRCANSRTPSAKDDDCKNMRKNNKDVYPKKTRRCCLITQRIYWRNEDLLLPQSRERMVPGSRDK